MRVCRISTIHFRFIEIVMRLNCCYIEKRISSFLKENTFLSTSQIIRLTHQRSLNVSAILMPIYTEEETPLKPIYFV